MQRMLVQFPAESGIRGRMPRYYFHLCEEEGGIGEELPDDTAARSAAQETLGEMIRDNPGATALRMRVTDERGRQVAKLNFSAE